MLTIFLAGIPLLGYASSHQTISSILDKIKTEILDPVIAILFVLATVVFMWGVIQYVIGSGGNETMLARGKRVMLYGIVGMFIMSSAWGIIRILCFFFVTCAEIFPIGNV